MKNSIIIRFAIAAVLISAGCALLLAGVEHVFILFGLATIFFMPRSELTQPVSRRELWAMFGVLLALVVAIIAARHFLPSSAADIVGRVIHHPVFVVFLWLFMMWGLFRHYQRQKGGVDA